MRIYGTYRSKRMASPYNLGQVTMNGTYTPSFFLDNQYADYKEAGLTRILDSIIPEDKYTGEIVPGVKKLTRFIVGEYNEAYIDPVDFASNVKNVGAEFQIEMFATLEETKTWVRDNTILIERSEGVFVIREESIGMMGEVMPEELLTIE